MNQGDVAPYEIPVPFYVLKHPKGNMTIDGGTAIEAASDPRGNRGAAADVYHPVMAADEGCVAQLRKIGLEPEDIRYVMQSHLHIDHSGSVGRFPNATHVVQRAEYEYAFTPDWYAAPVTAARILTDRDLSSRGLGSIWTGKHFSIKAPPSRGASRN
jgi:N-acyl homoserine lactone hydrolase